jgi:pectate lyase
LNARCGSAVLVEGNYTYNAKYTVAFLYDTSGASPGTWNLADNTYVLCESPNTTSTGDYRPTYAWTAEPSASISTSVPPTVGVGIIAVP